MSQGWWRRWHRWVGFVAVPFLSFAAITGIIAGIAEFTGEDEAAREEARTRVSDVRLPTSPDAITDPIAKALASASQRATGSPVDKVSFDLKAEPPTVTVYLGHPTGGEDRKLLFDAHSGTLLREEAYVDKPFLTRLHSGEAFGDGGLVLGMAWGGTLLFLIVSGVIIYFAMRKPERKGLQRLFW